MQQLTLRTRVINELGQTVPLSEIKWADFYWLDDQPFKHFPVHPGQADILNSPARFKAAIGGVNSGKSAVGALWLSRQIEQNPKGEFLVVAPTFDIVKGGTLSAWKKVIRGTELEGDWISGQSPEYRCKTGAKIFFRSGVKDNSLTAMKPLAAWIDEAGQLSKDAFDAVRERLVGTAGPCILTTTPYIDQNWIRSEIKDPSDKGNPLFFYRQFPSWFNPEQDRDSLEWEKKTLPPWKFSMKYLGEFTRPAGAVYPDFDSCLCDLGEVPFGNAIAYLGGADWGGADPVAFIMSLVDESGTLWIFDEIYIHDRSEDILQTIDRVLDYNTRWEAKTGRRFSWYCDHRPDIIRALKRKGLHARPANKGKRSIENGITYLTARLRKTLNGLPGGIKITRSCTNLIREASLYSYPMQDGQAYGATPIDAQNHACDAARYIVLSLDRKSRLIQRAISCCPWIVSPG